MKKTLLTIAIVFGMTLTTFADGGGLFQRGTMPEQENGIFGKGNRTNTPMLPNHNESTDQDADEVPMGTGIAVLAVLGGAYLVGKKRREE